MGRVPHLGRDGEEGRGTSVGKDDGGEGRDGLGESRFAVDNLVIGDPDAVLRSQRRAVLDADCDGDDED